MSFRRLPFQFSTTDPADRHAELLRKFGVSKDGDMLVESPNSSVMDGLGGSSPRLQHRIPQFMNEGKESIQKDNSAENVDSGKPSPRVRVIPIQIEGSTTADRPNRQRTKSGGSVSNSRLFPEDRIRSNSNSSLSSFPEPVGTEGKEKQIPIHHESSHSSQKPKVFNIPVFVEGRDNAAADNQKSARPVEVTIKSPKKNGPCLSKSSAKSQCKEQKSVIEISLDQIAAVLKELESYKGGVENFVGLLGDKQYRYLDEMLTRCMLKLDDVDTHGNEKVRQARKAAVREVEKYVGMLDSKVKASDEVTMTGDDTNKKDTNVECSIDEQPVNGSEIIDHPEKSDIVMEDSGQMETEKSTETSNLENRHQNVGETETCIMELESKEDNQCLGATSGEDAESKACDIDPAKHPQETMEIESSFPGSCDNSISPSYNEESVNPINEKPSASEVQIEPSSECIVATDEKINSELKCSSKETVDV